MNKVTRIYGWKGCRIHNSFSKSSKFGENVGLIPKRIFLLLLVHIMASLKTIQYMPAEVPETLLHVKNRLIF